MPEATTSVISDADLTSLLNDGQLDIARKTECIESSADSTVVASTQEYSIPTGCIRVTDVYYGGTGEWEKLPMVSREFLANEIDDSWFDTTGTTYGYYRRADKVGLYCTPTSNEAGTNYLRIYYIKQPDTLSGDTDEPFDSLDHLKPYHESVLLYAMFHAKWLVGKWEQADVIEAKYLSRVRDMEVELSRMDDFQQVIQPYHRRGAISSVKQNPLDQ
jgi:hypothetical protein